MLLQRCACSHSLLVLPLSLQRQLYIWYRCTCSDAFAVIPVIQYVDVAYNSSDALASKQELYATPYMPPQRCACCKSRW